jgi:hypothetical protein
MPQGLGVLQHMPASSLTQLSCTAEWQDVLPAHFSPALTAADYAAVCGLTGLRSLTLGHWPVGSQQPYALGPSTMLQQLTALRLETVGRQQLGLLQLPQLQALYVGLDSGSTAQLQLGHLSSVSRLWVQDRLGRLQPDDTLPPNVVDLWWHNSDVRSVWSMQPLLRLRCLRKLQLRSVWVAGATAVQLQEAAADLARLSSLSSLQEVELAYDWSCFFEGVETLTTAEAAAVTALSAAWQVLPLTSLALDSACIPVSALQQALLPQAVSTLQLVQTPSMVPQLLAPAALTSLLQHTTAQQQLQLGCHLDCSMSSLPHGLDGGLRGAADAEPVGDIARLLMAVCSLLVLEVACVKLGVQLSAAAVCGGCLA